MNYTIKPGLKVRTRSNDGFCATSIFKYKDAGERDRQGRELLGYPPVEKLEVCDVKSLNFVTPNRASIETGHATFDRQFQGVSTGNYISNTILGTFVRPRNEVMCNGRSFDQGHLQRHDLDTFQTTPGGTTLASIVRGDPFFEENGGIVYVIRHFVSTQERSSQVVHGAIITDRHLQLRKVLPAADLSLPMRASSASIMDVVTPWLTDAVALNLRPFEVPESVC